MHLTKQKSRVKCIFLVKRRDEKTDEKVCQKSIAKKKKLKSPAHFCLFVNPFFKNSSTFCKKRAKSISELGSFLDLMTLLLCSAFLFLVSLCLNMLNTDPKRTSLCTFMIEPPCTERYA